MTESLYTKKQMADLLKVKPRTIQYYTEEGLIVPAENPAGGKGSTRKYSEHNFFQFLLIKELSTLGFDLKTIKQIVKALDIKVISTVGGTETVQIYDGHSESGKLSHGATDENHKCTIDMKDRAVAIVINISKIRENAQKVMPKL